MKFLLAFFLLAFSVLLAAYFTGKVERAYPTLLLADTIYIAGQPFSVEKLALAYKPKMLLRPSTPSPSLKWIWYEAVPNKNNIDITYFYTWENEINPNKIFHKSYAVFRAAYYGYPLYDIEYFQVSINRLTGAVERLRFENSGSEDYFQATVGHSRVVVEKDDDGRFYSYQVNKAGNKTTSEKLATLLFDGKHVLVGVQTWNHLTRLLDEKVVSDYSILQDAPLKYLSEADFRQYKFARKSQGDHRTKENKWLFYVVCLFTFLCVVIPVFFMVKRKRRWGRMNGEW